MESKITQLTNLLQFCIGKKANLQGRLIHAVVLRNGFFTDIFLSNKLVEFYSICGNLSCARKVFDKMPHRNVYSWNAIVSACSKAGNLDDALHLFGKMPERNVISWNTIISALVRNGLEGEALNLYYKMNRNGFKPTHFTFASVLSACGGLMCLEHGRRCHGLVIKVGLGANMYVGNALVGMYAKCKSIVHALQLFDEMSEPNEVTCTAMMGGLAQTDRVEDALKMFAKMHRNGIPIDQVAMSSILNTCARAEDGESDVSPSYSFWGDVHGQQVHALTMKLGFESCMHVGNSLIDMYMKCGNVGNAEMVFATLPEVNVVSWNVLIAGYGQQGYSEKAVELLKQMQWLGFIPDEVTYVSMLGACVKSGDIEIARDMFDKMSSPSVSSWNAILSGYCQKGNHAEVVELFRKMQFVNVPSDRTTLAIILSSCAGIGLIECGRQVHGTSTKAMLHVDVYVASGLVDMYSKCGNIDVARRVFDRMPERDVVGWNSMIGGFTVHSLNREAFALYRQMQGAGMRPTQFSYASVISSCAKLVSLSQGRQVHAQISKDGYINDIFVGSSLIDMYAKCGNVEEARQFFDGMPEKNIVSWNEMINGYGQNGFGDMAVVLFEDMLLTEEKPDSITFIAVLTACSHSGLVDDGIKFFNSMKKDHGIEPLVDHYTCIIDSLGRAGRLGEAEVLIDKMPCINDPIIWEVLLSACKVHGNVNLGKKAAEKLFHLDPKNSAPYVLLFNIYAALGRWDDASAVRAQMSYRGLVKDPGYSWAEHAFMADDNLNMVADEDKVQSGTYPPRGVAQNFARGEICAT